MKDKRKEILRDLLGEFATDDESTKDSNDIFGNGNQEKEDETKSSPPKSDDDGFNLDKVMKRPSKRVKSVKKVSDVMKAEIIDEGLIPTYNVSIPKFSEKERIIFNEVREKLVEVAVAQGEDFRIDEESFIGEVKEFLRSKGVRDVDRLATQISQEMLGYGQLDPMIKDDDLEEIMVIGFNRNVFVYHRKIGMMITNVIFEEDSEIKAIIDVIARQVNRRIDQQTPILDARLPDGSRVNATIPPVSADGSTLTIRKFRKDPLTIIDLINFKTLSSHLAGFLWVCTDGLGVKPCNAIIAGGTGSGKTTTLNAVTAFTPHVKG